MKSCDVRQNHISRGHASDIRLCCMIILLAMLPSTVKPPVDNFTL